MRIILAIFNDRFEAFTSLKPFFKSYPEYEDQKDRINYFLSRRKQPFVDDGVKIVRMEVKQQVKQQ